MGQLRSGTLKPGSSFQPFRNNLLYYSQTSPPLPNMYPYEANPEKIPETDRYAQPDDFHPNPEHILSTSAESLAYWSSVLDRCDASIRIYENTDGGRDVFALGSMIVKSSHLKERLEGRRADRDYSYADVNEVEATTLARKVLGDVRVPRIYFASQVFSKSTSI